MNNKILKSCNYFFQSIAYSFYSLISVNNRYASEKNQEFMVDNNDEHFFNLDDDGIKYCQENILYDSVYKKPQAKYEYFAKEDFPSYKNNLETTNDSFNHFIYLFLIIFLIFFILGVIYWI